MVHSPPQLWCRERRETIETMNERLKPAIVRYRIPLPLPLPLLAPSSLSHYPSSLTDSSRVLSVEPDHDLNVQFSSSDGTEAASGTRLHHRR